MKAVGSMQLKASARLSSGYRINSAADDAAGLAISEKMRSQIRGLDMASRNVSDAISLIKTAEGGMQEIDNMLQRIRELVNNAANDTNEHNAIGTGDRQKIQEEINQLTKEIDDMSERVEFNKKRLINGTFQDVNELLNSARNVFERTETELSMAQTRLDTLSSAMNRPLSAGASAGTWNPGTPGATPPVPGTVTGFAAPDWDISGPKELLEFYQLYMDSVRLPAFRESTAIFTQAEVTYQQQVEEYNSARVELLAALSSANLGSLASIDERQFDPNEPSFFLGHDRTSRLIAAAQRYNAAADTLGIDELGMQDMTATPRGRAAASALGFTGAAGAPAMVSAATANKRWTDTPPVAGSGIAAFQDAQTAFTQAKALHDRAVADRSRAQSMVNAAQQRIDAATRERNAARVNYEAAVTSFRAAMAMAFPNGDMSSPMFDPNHPAHDPSHPDHGSVPPFDPRGLPVASAISAPLHFQVGANANQSLFVSIGSLKTNILGIGDGVGTSFINVLTDSGVNITATIDVLDQAMSYVTTERAKLGAVQNRLEHTQNSLEITSENISDAHSRIKDADMAKEMMNVTKSQVLQQAAVSMLAQANQIPQNVLQLLRQ